MDGKEGNSDCDPRGDSLEGKSELLKAEDLGATAGRTEKQDVSIGVRDNGTVSFVAGIG